MTEIIEAESHENRHQALILRPVMRLKERMAVNQEITEYVSKSLESDLDFGIIPYTDKPALYKPGAEKITNDFGCYAKYEVLEREFDHDKEVKWSKTARAKGGGYYTKEGKSYGFYRYLIKCQILTKGTNLLVAECVGSCSTMESKYVDRPRDCENTVLKMAQKRAHVGATLSAFNLSNRFTQDAEDHDDDHLTEVNEEDGKKKQPGFDPADKKHMQFLTKALEEKKIPNAKWQEITDKMKGRPATDIGAVMKEYQQ